MISLEKDLHELVTILEGTQKAIGIILKHLDVNKEETLFIIGSIINSSAEDVIKSLDDCLSKIKVELKMIE